MTIREYLEELRQNRPKAWMGVHYTDAGACKSIMKSGLLMTLIPGGGKYECWKRACIQKGKKPPKIGPFKSTISHFPADKGENDLDRIFERDLLAADNCVLICIPDKVVNALGGSPNDYVFPQKVCGYGFQKLCLNRNGTFYLSEIKSCKKTDERANVRMLPSCFVLGYFDKETNFVENPAYYENLPEEKQDKIVSYLSAEKNAAEGNGK